jgi:hypothetical protein
MTSSSMPHTFPSLSEDYLDFRSGGSKASLSFEIESTRGVRGGGAPPTSHNVIILTSDRGGSKASLSFEIETTRGVRGGGAPPTSHTVKIQTSDRGGSKASLSFEIESTRSGRRKNGTPPLIRTEAGHPQPSWVSTNGLNITKACST